MKYVMALDAGATSNRCILFDKEGSIVSVAQREFKQVFPQPGWVEHDAEEIWETQLAVAQEALQRAGAGAVEIEAIGITNQRETVVVWDRSTGEPICPAIVWQCRRTAPLCDELKGRGLEQLFREKTGLVLDPYFSGTKLRWILEEVEGARERAERGELLAGTIETWLIWNLTGGRVHATDVSNASRTLLFNIHTLDWDEELLEILQIPRSLLPEVHASSGVFGETAEELFGAPIPIAGAAGDQQAALFGQACFAPGDVKNTYGTGGFLLMNTGSEPVSSKSGLLTTVAWMIDGKAEYALEGSVFVVGAAIQWLRDELGILPSAAASEEIARSVEDAGGCYIVPAFTGLGAPYWDPYARGVIVGLSRGVNRSHIVRATVESMAYQVNDVVRAMESDAGIHLSALKVDGGAAANELLLQMQADISDAPVIRPRCIETTSLGAAYLAGLAVGYWKSKEEIAANAGIDREFSPSITQEQRDIKVAGWKRAVACAKLWGS